MNLGLRHSLQAFMIVSALFAVGCSDDDSKNAIDNELVGTWKWTVNERLNCAGDEGVFDVYDCTDFCYQIEFKNGGVAIVTVIQNGTTQSGEGTYTLSNSEYTLCLTDGDAGFCESGKIEISGDKFTWFVEADDDTVCDVNRTFERI